ncbi:glycosyltransferase [Methylobacterium sp. E-065]|uniref:glycosyltransferase n=1 Tax=Methylobacterium sp. E-065 TaxID=2836583 RepID=UPI001FB976D1|nr:glycosyltransferase [Methylobacterium sp. E-065]MCJ2020675.1 glycosyltransferase [Methylobacterium sp. E-065]
MTLLGKRIAVVLPAYNAAATLQRTYSEIPLNIVDDIILIDDASHDETVALAETLGIYTHRHPCNRGYGGNQKTCYRIALERGADIVVMLHPACPSSDDLGHSAVFRSGGSGPSGVRG